METQIKYLLTIKYKDKEPNKIPFTFWDKHTITNVNDKVQIRYSPLEKKVRFYTILPSISSDSFEVEINDLFSEDDLTKPTFTSTIILGDELYIFERQGEI